MKNFIRNIKEHKKIALICLALIIILVVVTVLVMKLGGKSDSSSSSDTQSEGDGNKSGYFSDSKYPVSVTASGSTATISLEAKDSSDNMKWELSVADDSIASAEFDGKDTDKKLDSTLTPKGVGYTTVTYKRTGELNGVSYDSVNLRVDVTVYADDDSGLHIRVDNVHQSTSSSGAVDSKTPYLLKDNRVIFPAGGDWTLTAEPEGKLPKGLYVLLPGTDDEGHSYYEVSMNNSLIIKDNGEVDMDAINSRLVLQSESLGVKKKLKCVMNAEKEWKLVEAEE